MEEPHRGVNKMSNSYAVVSALIFALVAVGRVVRLLTGGLWRIHRHVVWANRAGWGAQILMRPAAPRESERDVRFWHKADCRPAMSAFGGRADIEISGRNACF
jgi:hypothetical protein